MLVVLQVLHCKGYETFVMITIFNTILITKRKKCLRKDLRDNNYICNILYIYTICFVVHASTQTFFSLDNNVTQQTRVSFTTSTNRHLTKEPLASDCMQTLLRNTLNNLTCVTSARSHVVYAYGLVQMNENKMP